MYYLARRETANGTGDTIVGYSEAHGIVVPEDGYSYEVFWSDFGIPEGYDPNYHQLVRGRDPENGWWTIGLEAKQRYMAFDAAFRNSAAFGKALTSNNLPYLTFLLCAMYCDKRPAVDRFNDFFYALQQIIAGLPVPLTQTELDDLNTVLTDCYFPTI